MSRAARLPVLLIAGSGVATGMAVGTGVRERHDYRYWWVLPIVLGAIGLLGLLRRSVQPPVPRNRLWAFGLWSTAMLGLGLAVTRQLESWWMWIWLYLGVGMGLLILASHVTPDDRPD